MFLGGPGMPFGAPFQNPFGLEAMYHPHAAYLERFGAVSGVPGGPTQQGKAALDLLQQVSVAASQQYSHHQQHQQQLLSSASSPSVAPPAVGTNCSVSPAAVAGVGGSGPSSSAVSTAGPAVSSFRPSKSKTPRPSTAPTSPCGAGAQPGPTGISGASALVGQSSLGPLAHLGGVMAAMMAATPVGMHPFVPK
ncbi:hypothetical protein BIW11_08927 [Tropilaelaps mercedesae]|uniref:Uncharacterized protein n=1 Tax=Tropilaelaps mercedesae TaxID=418985 RepID=A0A1V9XMK3_9ACAR|nr:hypothetical protein BIW11_08927 [Tropilaelaps mercedesae]